jgi:pimeloyl-ACP methyl ester carboxylesterase
MRRPFGLLAAVLLAVAGCGGDSHPAAREAATPAATAPGRHTGTVCGETAAGAQAIRFRTRDGVGLAGAVVGSGPVGAVLIHEYPLDYCGWLPYARYLSRHGVRVLLFDLRCFGQSDCPGGRGHAVSDVAASMAEECGRRPRA